MASSAALSGLFQPYTVGKFNISVGFGGYNSQTAVAGGMGFRGSEHIAFKAGIATTGNSSVAYNGAVNFEW